MSFLKMGLLSCPVRGCILFKHDDPVTKSYPVKKMDDVSEIKSLVEKEVFT